MSNYCKVNSCVEKPGYIIIQDTKVGKKNQSSSFMF